jgi:hypothetical protein
MHPVVARVHELLGRQRCAGSSRCGAELGQRRPWAAAPRSQNCARLFELASDQQGECGDTVADLEQGGSSAPGVAAVPPANDLEHPHEAFFVGGVQRLSARPEVDAPTRHIEQLGQLLPRQTRTAEGLAVPTSTDDERAVADPSASPTPITPMPRQVGASDEGEEWSPVPFACLAKPPRMRNDPLFLRCPDRKFVGTVFLEVQLRKDGSVRDVVLVQGIEEGCDEAALKAVRAIEWTRGLDEAGNAVDVIIPYEYIFEGGPGADAEAAPNAAPPPPRTTAHAPCRE